MSGTKRRCTGLGAFAIALCLSGPTAARAQAPALADGRISIDDARQTVDLGDRFAIEPDFVEYPRTSFVKDGVGVKVPENFAYTSDTAERLDGPGMLALLDACHA